MDNLTIAAASGIRTRMESLDLLANNLANAATSGYKQDQEFYGVYASQDSDAGEDGSLATMPVIQRQWTDFSPGTLQTTGNPLDVALTGSGFFTVDSPSGPLYTRNGNLQILGSGELATAEGFPLVGVDGNTIHVASGKPVEISPQGVVTQSNKTVGRLAVVDFKSLLSLQKVAGTCFKNADPKNLPAPAASTAVMQGKLESSNVPVATAAMHLVDMMRQFEMLQKAIGISAEMDTKSIQEVARVGS